MATQQPLLTGASALYDDSKELRKAFTWKDRFGEVYYAWKSHNGRLMVPRAMCPLGIEDKRIMGRAIGCTPNLQFTPRDSEQARVVKESCSLIKAGRSFIVQAPTGFGKTVVAMPMLLAAGRKTLIVVPKTDLYKNWREALTKIAGIPLDRIGLIQANKCDYIGKDVVLSTLQSIHKEGRYSPKIKSEFGMVIFDEVDTVGATKFSQACWQFPAHYRLGLTATPYRSDGRDKLVFGHIGPIEVVAEDPPMIPKVLRYVTNWRCPRQKTKHGLVRVSHHGGKDMHIKKTMVRNLERNEIIARLAIAAQAKNRTIVIFSDLTAHLENIHGVLVQLGTNPKDISYYVGGMKEAELEAAANNRIILATYKMCGRGTNFPHWDTCILGTPRSNVEQICGRVMRKPEDGKTKRFPVIFDLIDRDSLEFCKYAQRRENYYKKLGAPIKYMNTDKQ